MSVSDSMQIPLPRKVQGSDFSAASREGICMSFVTLIHPVLVAGWCHFPVGWEGGSLAPTPCLCPSMKKHSWHGVTQSREMTKAGQWSGKGKEKQSEGKKRMQSGQGVGWRAWVGTGPCILHKLSWVFCLCGSRALNTARPQGSLQCLKNRTA